MSDQLRTSRVLQPVDESDLTQSLRRLTVADAVVNELEDQAEQKRSALLICRDSASKKWGPRWLKDCGFEALFPTKLTEALETARTASPTIIIVDAGLRDQKKTPLFEVLLDAPDIDAPLVVLCANAREADAAMDAGVTEIVRKPFDWRLIARRVRQSSNTNSTAKELAIARDSLSEALAVADTARVRLRSRESFEPITGLPNKTKFVDLLKRGMSAADRDGTALAVFVIGFNRFRLVIEALGQENADLVLAEIGNILSESLDDTGSAQANTEGLKTAAAASIDTSRFGLMLTCSGSGDDLSILQQKLIEKLSRPVQVSGQTIYLSACVGVALYPQDASDVDSLLQRADNAMRDAQSRGGGFKFYCPETDAAAARKLKLEHMLHEAFANNELVLAYQPMTEMASGRLTGAEALLRWKQSDDTFISPVEFVPIAEECGLMIPIGEFVLDQACGQLKSWQQQELPLTHMCVNVSKCQLMSGGFVGTVSRLLEKHALNPACLELELSERGVLSGDYDVISQLHALRELGVKLSIDDFGTGDSAMAYLRELPIDVMKIDRSYINGLAENDKDTAITSAMVALGQNLNLKVVAEGVETARQLEILKDLGCDEYQGFYQSPAVATDEFVKLLQKINKK